MTIDEKTYKAMPDNLRALFTKLPNPGSQMVLDLFPQSSTTGKRTKDSKDKWDAESPLVGSEATNAKEMEYTDSGSAARFFYCAKASKRDRDDGCEGMELNQQGRTCYDPQYHEGGGKLPPRSGNHHPTVKPTALMQYLCRLVTPPGGVILDPFMGSGSTGKAAVKEGFGFIGMDKEFEYVNISKARII